MKQKPDETPDEWVRHMLDRLPDAPPPGSSFDSARLWNQLRPELQPKPNRQRAWWWVAAACLAALLVGWQVWTLSNSELKMSPARQAATHSPQTDPLPGTHPKPIEKIVESGYVVAETHQPKRQRNTTRSQSVPRPNNVAITPESLQLAPVALSTEPVATSTVANGPAPRKANVAAVMPKRRFRVIHENELRAEDEAAPKIYRTDHFVRLGSSSRHEDQPNDNQRNNTAPDNSPPTLVMPLKTH